MGIKNLISLIKTKAPNSVQIVPIDKFANKVFAIDSYVSFYASSIATNFSKSNKILQDQEGNPTAHLIYILNSTVMYKAHRIVPIWVFDGTPPELKGNELEKRKSSKILNAENFTKATDEASKQKFAARSWRLSEQMIKDSQDLLKCLGQDLIQAENEAEAQCAILCKTGQADIVLSEDSDTLIFGSPILAKGGKELTLFNLDQILMELKLTMDQFIDLAILLGSDYGPGIKGIGKVKALEYITKFASIEKICEEIKNSEKFEIPANFEYEKIRKFFRDPVVESGKIVKNQLNLENLQNFLKKRGFSDKSIENYVKKLS